MAQEEPDVTDLGATFEEVDWDAQKVSKHTYTRRDLAEVASFLLLGAVFAYDFVFLDAGDPLIGNWNVLGVEWMFIATLLLMWFHMVMPLYERPRLRRFYWRRFKNNKVAVASLIYLVVIFTIGIFGPALMDPPQAQFVDRLKPPLFVTEQIRGEMVTGTMAHPLGTSQQGRDVLKLIVYGMRVSMEVGLISTAFAVLVGAVVGTLAAFATSVDAWVIDEVLMRYVDVQAVFPTFILLLLLTYMFGQHMWMIVFLLGFFSWEGIARTVRGEALQRAEAEYILAARAAGADTAHILRRHLIPNSSNSIIVSAAVLIPIFILTEASLAFLGFSDPSLHSWGQTISKGQGYLRQAWWVSFFPGVFLFFTVLGFNFIGEAMQDAMDPRRDTEEGGL